MFLKRLFSFETQKNVRKRKKFPKKMKIDEKRRPFSSIFVFVRLISFKTQINGRK